ncbi:hypothetical protein [Micromonospora cathayae]|uniref:Flagellar basal body-associated protein FliL n=1 Tax=Micromonospora cathayae TaxID=3028804 RepID=A0ABY7ZX34_9ACTN|nr:hypothetical protein [Micromonospora sp. HUAS 3]WDZ87637.1 hypothetical protein PVK37_15110 [Micromonospora sp. HUAS 3]
MSQPHHPEQPQFGSDNPAQPSSGYGTPPGYGPTPTPPGPAQPGFPGAAQPGFAAAPPPAKKSGVGKVLLIVLAVVLVLCLGGAAVTWFAVKDEVGEVVDATNTTVVTPDTLNGRAKSTEPGLTTVSQQMVEELKKDVPEATGTVGAFYGGLEKQDLAMVVAVSGLIADPKQELQDFVTTSTSQLGTSNLADVEPGPLGGEAKCGDGKTEGLDLGICVWADRGSLGMVVLYYKTGKQAEAEFATIRSAIEQRN